MSATLRYDIGQGAADVLNRYDGGILTAALTYADGSFKPSLLAALGAKQVNRWAGIRRGGATNQVVTFACKLPSQVGLTYELMHRAYWLARDHRMLPTSVLPQVIDRVAKRSLAMFDQKLSLSLGLGHPVTLDGEEAGFVDAIRDDPNDLANWSAYADWLQERPNDEKMNVRGRVIAGWLGPKALKVKYGVPVIAQPEKWG